MKKFLQKSLRRMQTLLLLAVMTVVGGSAWADGSVTINLGQYGYNGVTEGPITATYQAWNYTGAEIYGSRTLDLSGEGVLINRVDFFGMTPWQSWCSIGLDADFGVFSPEPINVTSCTWTDNTGASFVTFKAKDAGSDDFYVQSITVYYKSLPTIDYHVVITHEGSLPDGFTPSVTVDGETFTANGTHSVAKGLNENNISATVPNNDWYYEVTYDAENDHTFTVTYKEYNHYTVSVTGCEEEGAGVKVNNDWRIYGNDNIINVKETLTAENLTVADVNGYVAGTPVVGALDGHNATITVPYTLADIKDYTVIITGMPEGASVKVEEETFSANGTFTHQSRKNLNRNSASVQNCPATHYYNDSYEWYNSETTTFSIEFTPYLVYTVAVDEASAYKGEDAGVKVKYGNTYHVGDPIYTRYEYTLDNVEAAEVDGYTGTVTLTDKEFTVSYAKNEFILFKGEDYFGTYEYGYVDDTKEGVRLEGFKTYDYMDNQVFKVYNNTRLKLTSETPIVKVELDYVWVYGDHVTNWTTGSMNEDNSVWTGEATSLEFWDANDWGIDVKAIKVWLKKPVDPSTLERFDYLKVSPAVGEVTELSKYFTVYAGDTDWVNMTEEGEKFTTTINTGAGDELPAGVTFTDADNNPYTISSFYLGGQQINITLENSITTPGTYTLHIPAALGVTESNKTNGEWIFTWTVLDPVVGHLAMSDAGYATLCVDYAYTLPEGYTAYAVGKDVNGTATLVGEDGSIILNPLNSVAAGTAVIIEGPEAADVTLLRASSASAPAVNFLVGFTYEANNWSISNIFGTDWCPGSPMVYDTFSNFSIYQLANEESKVGFYRQKAEEGKFYCAANKAVLVVPAPDAESNARFLLPGQEVITGIDSVIATEAAENIFNLQGQRVIAPAKGGVYVKNGKKIIVK